MTTLAVDAVLVGTPGFTHPQAQVGAHLFVGRQGIFARNRQIHGYEFLYRAGRQHSLRVDQWPPEAQDRATLRVLQATFGPSGVQSLASDALVFVNFTRSFIVDDLPVPAEPDRLVIEVVESVRADDAVIVGLQRLRSRGFRIAIDDFVGLKSQVAMLRFADYVKVDHRDLFERGPELAALAGSRGAHLVAERIETAAQFQSCQELGFEFFQGFYLETPHVLNRTPIPSQRSDRPVLRVLDAVHPRFTQSVPHAV
jgi:EAL and modified HD-GYP domain-containing signal transduction protein